MTIERIRKTAALSFAKKLSIREGKNNLVPSGDG